MKTDKRSSVRFIAVLAVFLFSVVPGNAGARLAAELEHSDNAGSSIPNPSGRLETAVMPGASSQTYYVVSDNLYVLVQKPMAKAYGAFSMKPVIVSDVAGYSDEDTGPAGLASGDTLRAGESSSFDRAEQGSEKLQGTEVAINMNFRRAADKPEKPGAGADSSQDNEDIADPLEPINRVFFTFNDKFYFWAVKPAARVYGLIVPEWGRMRVRNVFDNVQAPVRLVNALLQLKMHKVGTEFARFVLNSTVGVAGLFDIASRHPELITSEEDLGQTFGAYGLGEGFYLVLPFLGPSSLRDTAGTVGDYFLDPIGHITPVRDAIVVRSFDRVNDTSFKIGDYEDIKESAMDAYISIRDMYKQFRRNKIRE
ncbi:MAG: VacJ family lipoprotein [Nitrospirae bacterium]|nr:VacJ family lipoprotein [Nitrospirota bacterium]